MGKKRPKPWSLTTYLQRYYKHQSRILLVYRPTKEHGWADRCFYLDDKYNPQKKYNHRSILHNEVVIEYDGDDKEQNKTYIDEVCRRLHKDKVYYAKWDTSNRSTHVHVLIDTGNAKNVPLLKRCFIRHYTDGLGTPDLQMATEGHLIRAEFGAHERTGRAKTLLSRDKCYPCISNVVPSVWDRYYAEQRRIVARRLTRDVTALVDHPGMQYILTAHQFREAKDGHERALFMLIHVLKPKHTKDSLKEYMREWYRYSGGEQLSDQDIDRKVDYHWNRTYEFGERYLRELLESIGKEELMNVTTKS